MSLIKVNDSFNALKLARNIENARNIEMTTNSNSQIFQFHNAISMLSLQQLKRDKEVVWQFGRL